MNAMKEKFEAWERIKEINLGPFHLMVDLNNFNKGDLGGNVNLNLRPSSGIWGMLDLRLFFGSFGLFFDLKWKDHPPTPKCPTCKGYCGEGRKWVRTCFDKFHDEVWEADKDSKGSPF